MRHRLYLVFPLLSRLRHRLYLVFPLLSRLRHRLCLVFPLPPGALRAGVRSLVPAKVHYPHFYGAPHRPNLNQSAIKNGQLPTALPVDRDSVEVSTSWKEHGQGENPLATATGTAGKLLIPCPIRYPNIEAFRIKRGTEAAIVQMLIEYAFPAAASNAHTLTLKLDADLDDTEHPEDKEKVHACIQLLFAIYFGPTEAATNKGHGHGHGHGHGGGNAHKAGTFTFGVLHGLQLQSLWIITTAAVS